MALLFLHSKQRFFHTMGAKNYSWIVERHRTHLFQKIEKGVVPENQFLQQ